MNANQIKQMFMNLKPDETSFEIVKGKRSLKKNQIAIRLDGNGLPSEIIEQAAGLQYGGRSENAKRLNVGQNIQLIRDPKNKNNKNNITIRDTNGNSLGNLSAELCDLLAVLLDSKEAKILSSTVSDIVIPDSSGRRKTVKLFINIKLKVEKYQISKNTRSTILLFGAQQAKNQAIVEMAKRLGAKATRRDSFQTLEIMTVKIPLEAMKLIFELFNRYWGEYDLTETDYMGMDFLPEEMSAAREKMKREKTLRLDWSGRQDEDEALQEFITHCIKKDKERYDKLRPYLNFFTYKSYEYDAELMKDFFNQYLEYSNKFFWYNEEQVTEDEYDKNTPDIAHWYEVAQLYNPEKKLPFDLNDEDTISIFGFNQFVSMIDLSHGC